MVRVIRRWGPCGIVTALAIALIASPAAAHTLPPQEQPSSGASGVAIALLVTAAIVVGAGIATRAKLGKAALSWAVIALGLLLGGASFVVDRQGTTNTSADVHLSILEPTEGATVPAGQAVPVRVSVDAPVADTPTAKGGHLHLSVDGALQQMPYSTTADVTLTPGSHTVSVEYVDERHVSLDPPVVASVKVTAS